MKHVKKLTTSFQSKHSNYAPSRNDTSALTDPSFPCGLKVWYEPPAGKHLLDLVFVHGLTGDRQHTWTQPHASVPWPKSILPRHFPEARILTHGYDAYVILRTGPVSRNRLSDHCRDFLNALVASCLSFMNPANNDRVAHERLVGPVLEVALPTTTEFRHWPCVHLL